MLCVSRIVVVLALVAVSACAGPKLPIDEVCAAFADEMCGWAEDCYGPGLPVPCGGWDEWFGICVRGWGGREWVPTEDALECLDDVRALGHCEEVYPMSCYRHELGGES